MILQLQFLSMNFCLELEVQSKGRWKHGVSYNKYEKKINSWGGIGINENQVFIFNKYSKGRIIEYVKIKCLEKKTKLIQQMKGTMERWSDCLGEFSLASIRRWRFLFQSSKQLFSISVHSLPQDLGFISPLV